MIYSVLFSIVLIYTFIEQQDDNFLCFFIGIFASTSTIYVASYFGLKLGSIRLNKNSRLRKTIDKVNIPGKELSIHICVIVVSLIIMSIPLKSSNTIIKEETVDKEILIRIEKESGRTDVNSVLKIHDTYIITFSDNK